MEWWQVYLFTLADAFDVFFGVIGILALLVAAIIAFASYIDNSYKNVKGGVKILAAIGILFCLLSMFIPNTKELAAIYLIPKITKNETISDLPSKMTDLLDKKLDEWINDTIGVKKDKNEDN